MMGGNILAAVVLCVVAAPGAAPAQEIRATVVETAPVYLAPDARRTPLRTLAIQTPLKVLADEGDWLRVEFPDPQFGPRVGYIEKKKVDVYRVDVRPPDLAPRDTARQAPPPEQTRTIGKPRPAAKPSPPAVRGYGTYGRTVFAASDTLEAVAGSSTFRDVGAGGTVTGVWRGFFVDVGVAQAKVDGERVFVDGETVHPLGIALQLTVRWIDVVGGWRFTTGRFSPYIGGGVTRTLYKETSAFSDSGDDMRDQKWGPLVLAGVDAEVMKWVHVGGELRYRAGRGILGEDGVSQAFGEDEVGGLSVGLRVSFGR